MGKGHWLVSLQRPDAVRASDLKSHRRQSPPGTVAPRRWPATAARRRGGSRHDLGGLCCGGPVQRVGCGGLSKVPGARWSPTRGVTLDPDLLRRTEPAYVHEADLLKSTVKPEPMRSPFARRQFSRKALDYRPTYRRNRGAPQGKHPSWIRWSRRRFSCAGNALRPARRLG